MYFVFEYQGSCTFYPSQGILFSLLLNSELVQPHMPFTCHHLDVISVCPLCILEFCWYFQQLLTYCIQVSSNLGSWQLCLRHQKAVSAFIWPSIRGEEFVSHKMSITWIVIQYSIIPLLCCKHLETNTCLLGHLATQFNNALWLSYHQM